MMIIFFTVDTEFWPRDSNSMNPDQASLEADISRDIYGETHKGDFGLNYQLDVLDSEGLKGVFFIEPLSALVAGIKQLSRVIELVESRGHSVELHLHTEWLRWIQPTLVSTKNYTFTHQLSLRDQDTLIKKGIELLNMAGLKTPVCAFRAGNYGASFETLHALAKNNIKYDSSYNVPYLDLSCQLRSPNLLIQPQYLEGLIEVPISFFQDYPRHFRHTQLTATSFAEMRLAIETAEKQGWKSFVIVSHSFELIKRNCHTINAALPDYTVIDRFEKLIRYLGKNKDRFKVSKFNEVSKSALINNENEIYKPLKGLLSNTAKRWVEQGMRRLAK